MDISRTITHRLCRLAAAAGLVAAAAAADEPGPAPTPRPGTLAAFASRTELDRSHTGGGAIVITDDTLDELGEGSILTLAGDPIAALSAAEPSATPAPKVRARWRKAVLAQRRVIARLEDRRDAAELEIDRLGRGRLDARTLDRIEKAEAKLDQIEAELARERAQLSRIVRDARKDGAQPGWFR